MRKNRKTPTEIIERRWFPFFESVYVKLPRNKLKDVSVNRDLASVDINYEKIKKYFKNSGKTETIPFSDIHVHPYSEKEKPYILPSPQDLSTFLRSRVRKSMWIAQQNVKTKKVEGYFVLIRTKERRRKEREEIYERDAGNNWLINHYASQFNKLLNSDKGIKMLNKLSEDFDLKYRAVPAKGYKFNGTSFVKKENPLESKVTSIISLACLSLSLVFLSSNITGKVFANLNPTSSNWLGGILFVVGIIAGFFWLKKRKPEIKKIKKSKKRKFLK